MIPYSPTIRRRSLRTFAFRPAGVAAPGTAVPAGVYRIVLQHSNVLASGVLGAIGRVFTTDTAALRSNLDGAFAALGVAARTTGPAQFDVQAGQYRVTTWLATIRVTAPTTQILLHRALARAAFHASSFSGKDPADGGAEFVSGPHFSFSVMPQSAPAPTPNPSTPTPTPNPSTPTAFVGKPEQQLSRAEVTRYQQMLIRAGHSVGQSGADGVIGSGTRGAVQAFQRAQGISSAGQAGYGTLGPQTQAALERAVPGTPAAPPTPSTPTPTVRPPAPTPTTPPSPTPTTPPSPPSTASMSGGTIFAVSLAAAAIGAGVAFRDTLFGGTAKPRAKAPKQPRARGRGR